MDFIDELTPAQLDRLQARLTARVEQRKAEKETAARERNNPPALRPGIGNAGTVFANDLARRNWDRECLAALAKQSVPFAVAPWKSFVARDGKRLSAGDELRPHDHLNALLGDQMMQVRKLVEDGYVLAREGAL